MNKKICSLVIFTLLSFVPILSHADIFVVSKQSANVYSEANTRSSILQNAKRGDWFIYLESSQDNKWRKVELKEGNGWIYYTNGRIEEDSYLDSIYSTTSPTCDFDIVTLEIHVINVGQGDSILIVARGGEGKMSSILVDAGKPARGRDFVVPYLKHLGISKLNYVILSHADGDHMGGLDEVLTYDTNDPQDYEIKLIGSAFMPESKAPNSYGDRVELDEYLEAVKKETGVNVKLLSPPAYLPFANGITVQVVAGGGEYIDKAKNGVVDLKTKETNATSIGLLIKFNKFQFFTAGDLVAEVEDKVAPYVDDIDVLKVSHHASETSTHSPFLSLVKPELALISTGEDNNYGHPRESVIQRLKQSAPNIAIYQTGEGNLTSGRYKNKTSREGLISGNMVISANGGCAYSISGSGSEFSGKKDYTDDQCN